MTPPAYHAIIVGAGSAGCVLANRLSSCGALRVLLLEAGPQNSRRNPYTRIPVGYYNTQMNPKFDWCFETARVPGLESRKLLYPRGKIVGGSSAVNGMIWVRGQADDFDGWAEKLGDDRPPMTYIQLPAITIQFNYSSYFSIDLSLFI